MTKKSKRILWLAVAVLLLAVAVRALLPKPISVRAVRVNREALTAAITAEGRSRIRDLYVVTSPVDGDLERVTLKAGDSVSPGAVLARVGPAAARPLDARARAGAEAAVEAARATLTEARAKVAEARGGVVHADSELTTARRLSADNAIARKAVEQWEHEGEIRRRSAEAAGAAVEVARSELARAEAQLGVGTAGDSRRVSAVRTPIAGRVLRVVRESGGPIAAGAPIVELGNLATLEFFADLLTADALAVKPGAEATIRDWGGPGPLTARVRRIEPAAFTKISALGLEEQRVRVVLDLTEPAPPTLGHDFKITAAIAVWKGINVLTVPATALFRDGASWAVFVVERGRARLRQVTAGRSDGQQTVLESGVREGEEVIAQPVDAIQDGTRVAKSPAK